MQDQAEANGTSPHPQDQWDQDTEEIDFPWETLEHPGPHDQNPGPPQDESPETLIPDTPDSRSPGPNREADHPPEPSTQEHLKPPAHFPQGSFEALKRDLNAPIPSRFLRPQTRSNESRPGNTGPAGRAPVAWSDMATYLDALTSKHSASWDYHVVKSRESNTQAIVTSRITVTASDGRAMTRESLGTAPLNPSGQARLPAQEEAERIAFVRAALMLGVKVDPNPPPGRQNQQYAKRS